MSKDKKTWYSIKNVADDTAEVMMYGDIGAFGVSASKFRNDFNGIKAAKIDVRINSRGGEVADGVAIATAIREHSATVTTHVDGLAASIASLIACSGDKCVISKGGFMMVHNPSTFCFGNSIDLRKQADLLDKFGGSIADVYAEKTGKTKDEIKKWMDDETWFDSSEAVECGLADEVKDDDEDGDDDDDDTEDRAGIRAFSTKAPLLLAQFKNIPDRVRRLIAQAAPGSGPSGQRQQSMANKVIARDGKQFVVIGGVEHEIENTATVPAPVVNTAGNDAAIKAAREEAAAQAVTQERAYRSMFSTVVASAGLTGEAAVKFEKDFYGRAETDLKFLASHAIGNRTQPIGEGSGEKAKEKKPGETDDKLAQAEADAGKRFDETASLRRTYGVTNSDSASDQWKSGRGRYVAAARKRYLDEVKNAPLSK